MFLNRDFAQAMEIIQKSLTLDGDFIQTFGKPFLQFGLGHAKICLMPYANNKDADQPAHSRSPISTFVVRC